MLGLVVYDIPDDKRRTMLATFLEGWGRRVQKSVFECYLSLAQMKVLHQQIQSRVRPDDDNVRLYWISADAVSRTMTIGSELPQPPPDAHII